MDALKSLVQPLVGGVGGSSMIDGVKLVVLGGTVETARRMASSGWSHFINSFFLTAHFSEEDYPYDWLMLWLSRRPEWQRSREFETTTRTSSHGHSSRVADNSFGDDEEEDEDAPGRAKTRVVFQPTTNTTHTIYYKGHWLRVKRGRKPDGSGCEMLSISVVARNNSILKQLVLQAKKEYEAEAVHRIQIYFADSHGCWRWTDSRHKRPMSSIVLNPGVKEMLLSDTKDFLKSEKWYADRGIPFRRGYLLHGVPGSGKSSLIHAIAGELMLDIYVVSLSSSWISDSTLTTLMGRVPARCIVLLEDLDAAFTRSTSRDSTSTGSPESNSTAPAEEPTELPTRHTRRHKTETLSEVNTLSLSGLLNALDGVAASEGRILFATTNHLERLDPALSRPGRMDVWVEFKHASKWQAELLFRNFFPSTDEDDVVIEGELEGVELPMPPSPSASSSVGSSSLFSMARSMSPMPSSPSLSSFASGDITPPVRSRKDSLREQAYLPPPIEDEISAAKHSAKPLDGITLAALAKTFADAIPDEEFSVAALQGCEYSFRCIIDTTLSCSPFFMSTLSFAVRDRECADDLVCCAPMR
ncbi:P-loop containing nucleoside triphosphate hydrolase protein [Amylocystis lapponica]|nr:P-loop containing nucleoside triphosphate hydrolase protein [Amylocystis lapponica]